MSVGKRKQRNKADVQELSNECPSDVQSGVGHCPTETETETETKTETKTERKKENAPAAARSHSPSDKGNDFVLKKKYGCYEWVELSNDEHAF